MNHEIMEKILTKLEDKNVTYGDIRIENSVSSTIRTINGQVEQSTTGIDAGLGIRVLNQGAYGFAYGPIESYDKVISMALQANKLNIKQKRQDIELAHVKIVKDSFVGEQKENLADMSFEEKIELTFEADKAMKEKAIKSRTTRYVELQRKMILGTTEGTVIEYDVPYLILIANAVAREGGQTIEGRSRIGHIGGLEILKERDPTKVGKTAVEQALSGLNAPKLKPGSYPVVLDGTINHLFAHEACGHSAEGDFVQTAGVLRGKLGKNVANSIVNLVDDGTLEEVNGQKTFGYLKYDDEGVPSKKTYIIRNGKLETYLTDRASAAHFDLEPTGNARAESYVNPQIVRMRNTYICTDDKNSMKNEELLELIGDGYFLSMGGGGQVDPIKGTFNFGVSKIFDIKNGEMGQQYKPTTLSGNTLMTLNKIIGISNTFEDPYESIGFCGKGGQSAPVGVTGGWLGIKKIVIG